MPSIAYRHPKVEAVLSGTELSFDKHTLGVLPGSGVWWTSKMMRQSPIFMFAF